jgi:hypothetical protein
MNSKDNKINYQKSLLILLTSFTLSYLLLTQTQSKIAIYFHRLIASIKINQAEYTVIHKDQYILDKFARNWDNIKIYQTGYEPLTIKPILQPKKIKTQDKYQTTQKPSPVSSKAKTQSTIKKPAQSMSFRNIQTAATSTLSKDNTITLGPLSFSKTDLNDCSARCSLSMQDSYHNTIKVVFFKIAFAQKLLALDSVYLEGRIDQRRKILFMSKIVNPVP